MYNYREAIISDIQDYINWNYTAEEIDNNMDNREEWEQLLYEDLWDADSVTGNGSGSYYCNTYRAEEAIAHNWDLLADAIAELGRDTDILRQGAEACDVTIRCYLLGECIAIALDQIEESACIPMF